MKKYLNVLLEAMDAAKENRPLPRLYDVDAILPQEMEEYLAGEDDERGDNLGIKIGLNKEYFPPETYWSDEEAVKINIAFHEMLANFNLAADIPAGLPPQLEYRTLVSVLDKHVPFMSFGTWHLEFCDYIPEECPFGEEYCHCKDSVAKYAKENDPKNIPFIHNYCDRWCERCTFTNRCAVYEHTKDLTPEEQDINNKAFWNKMAENLQKSLDDLKDVSDHFDIDEPTTEEMAEYRRESDDMDEKIEATKLIRWCSTYSKKTFDWLKKNEAFIDKIKSENPHLVDYIEVITWYLFFIEAKFKRAMSGKMDDLYEYEVKGMGFQTDSNGSAKIALVATQRSFEAWMHFIQHLPNIRDAVFPSIALLYRIINEGKLEFPHSDKFIRPGFDT